MTEAESRRCKSEMFGAIRGRHSALRPLRYIGMACTSCRTAPPPAKALHLPFECLYESDSCKIIANNGTLLIL